jgi:hypothetical protein
LNAPQVRRKVIPQLGVSDFQHGRHNPLPLFLSGNFRPKGYPAVSITITTMPRILPTSSLSRSGQPSDVGLVVP